MNCPLAAFCVPSPATLSHFTASAHQSLWPLCAAPRNTFASRRLQPAGRRAGGKALATPVHCVDHTLSSTAAVEAVQTAATVPDVIKRQFRSWGLAIAWHDITVMHEAPAMLRLNEMLTPEECRTLIDAQTGNTAESDLYLNYRVNREVESDDASNEAAALIESTRTYSSDQVPMPNAAMPSGFRVPVDVSQPVVQTLLKRLSAALGLGSREWHFEEGLWIRPGRRSVVVRDVTTVRYFVGEGVAPHVDGKDITILLCLQEPGDGGRTVFPNERLAATPVLGSALIYCSRESLVHFAEPVASGVKWVMQLLVDCRVREDELDVDYESGQVFS